MRIGNAYLQYEEKRFKQRLNESLVTIKNLLENDKTNPSASTSFGLADDSIPHKWEDKYRLTEFMTNMGIAAILNTFAKFGIDEVKLNTVSDERLACC